MTTGDINAEFEEQFHSPVCPKEGCTREAAEPHPCPFLEEIEEDSETLCTCCEWHEEECRLDI